MIRLFDTDSGAPVGEITEDQLQFLTDELEEESTEDRDYWINRDTVDMLESHGADAQLVEILRRALGQREEMEIRWEDSEPGQ